MPTTTPRSAAGTPTTDMAMIAGKVKATPIAKRLVPTSRPSCVGTRPATAMPTADTTSALPESRAAPIRSGSFAPTTRSTTTMIAKTAKIRARADLEVVGHQRQEREERTHPEHAAEREQAWLDAPAVDEAVVPVAPRARLAADSVSGASQLRPTATAAIAAATSQTAAYPTPGEHRLADDRPDRDAEVEREGDEADGLATPVLGGEVGRGREACHEEQRLAHAEQETHDDQGRDVRREQVAEGPPRP